MLPGFLDRFHAPRGPVTHIVAALGNPGQKYLTTRHNAGFMAVDYLCQKYGVRVDKLKFKSLCGELRTGGSRALLLKPQTFMNLSGEAVREAAAFYKIPPERIIVIFDDVSLPPGSLRIRRKGSDGGHNGVKSITQHLGTQDFPRIKLGVGDRPRPEYDLADWVLSEFTAKERESLFLAFGRCCDALLLMLADKTDEAMNRYND